MDEHLDKHLSEVKDILFSIGRVAAHSCPTKTKEEILAWVGEQAFKAFSIVICMQKDNLSKAENQACEIAE